MNKPKQVIYIIEYRNNKFISRDYIVTKETPYAFFYNHGTNLKVNRLENVTIEHNCGHIEVFTTDPDKVPELEQEVLDKAIEYHKLIMEASHEHIAKLNTIKRGDE